VRRIRMLVGIVAAMVLLGSFQAIAQLEADTPEEIEKERTPGGAAGGGGPPILKDDDAEDEKPRRALGGLDEDGDVGVDRGVGGLGKPNDPYPLYGRGGGDGRRRGRIVKY
jgi:hypothetical protein